MINHENCGVPYFHKTISESVGFAYGNTGFLEHVLWKHSTSEAQHGSTNHENCPRQRCSKILGKSQIENLRSACEVAKDSISINLPAGFLWSVQTNYQSIVGSSRSNHQPGSGYIDSDDLFFSDFSSGFSPHQNISKPTEIFAPNRLQAENAAPQSHQCHRRAP